MLDPYADSTSRLIVFWALADAGYLDRPFTGGQIREVVRQAVQEPTLARRILILEDEDDLRRIYSRALRHAGYDVHEATTLQEARDLLAQYAFDVLLAGKDIDAAGIFGHRGFSIRRV